MRKINNHQKTKILQLAQRLNFPQEHLSVLETALTHPTFFEGMPYGADSTNQRLEFLGDAVLDLLVGEYFFNRHQNVPEGSLTKMRAAVVCEASIARKAQAIGLGEALLLGRGGESGGDRERSSVLGDVFEAVLGAIYITGGITAARDFVLSQLEGDMKNLSREDYEDPKSLLQEYVQSKSGQGVHYRLHDSSGPSHAPQFTAGVYHGDTLLAEGRGGSKKESEAQAAKAALESKASWDTLLD